jgi:1,4-dihydroxy-6-naphthoate synthase
MNTKLSLGFSPCPNDCFIFDALVNGKIDSGGLEFDVQLLDVETLNQKALKGELDISKLSFHAYAKVMQTYIMLRSGSALGFNCGPLLVKKSKVDNKKALKDWKVAIPGELTTANFLFSIAYPQVTNKITMVFSEIEDAVVKGEVDAGLIIHESRFTYQDKGLEKVADLGEYWEQLIHAPIPLGGIAIKRNFNTDIQHKVNQLIRRSVEFAFNHPEASMPYVREHAQEMSEEVMKKHIALYVNAFSVDLGNQGIQAINLMFGKAKELKLIPEYSMETILE